MDNDIKIEDEGEAEGTEGKIKKLKEKLKKCQKEKEEYLDGWQRAKADFINARKEEEQKRQDFIKFSNQMMLEEILPILDSLDLAAKNSDDKGFALIKNQFSAILNKYGLEELKTFQEEFNPEFHEAVEEVKSEEKSGMIIEEVRKGYKLHNKILRPARVKISK